MGESRKDALRLDVDRKMKLEFHGTKVTSDAGLLAYRELDEALGLIAMINSELRDIRTGKNTQHGLAALLRQAIYSRLAGYDDTNDAERLAVDPAMRYVAGGRAVERSAASTSVMGRFETEILTQPKNLAFVMNLPGSDSSEVKVRLSEMTGQQAYDWQEENIDPLIQESHDPSAKDYIESRQITQLSMAEDAQARKAIAQVRQFLKALIDWDNSLQSGAAGEPKFGRGKYLSDLFEGLLQSSLPQHSSGEVLGIWVIDIKDQAQLAQKFPGLIPPDGHASDRGIHLFCFDAGTLLHELIAFAGLPHLDSLAMETLQESIIRSQGKQDFWAMARNHSNNKRFQEKLKADGFEEKSRPPLAAVFLLSLDKLQEGFENGRPPNLLTVYSQSTEGKSKRDVALDRRSFEKQGSILRAFRNLGLIIAAIGGILIMARHKIARDEKPPEPTPQRKPAEKPAQPAPAEAPRTETDESWWVFDDVIQETIRKTTATGYGRDIEKLLNQDMYSFEEDDFTPQQQQQIDRLLETIQNTTGYERHTAINELIKLGRSAKAIPVLIRAIDESTSITRYSTIAALGVIGPVTEEVIPKFMELLNSEDEKDWALAAMALYTFGPYARPAIPLLREKLNDNNGWVRFFAAFAIGDSGIRDAETIDAVLLAYEREEVPFVKPAIIYAISRIGLLAKETIPSLAQNLDSEHRYVRIYSIHALGKMGKEAKSTLPQLRALIEDQDALVASSVRLALTMIILQSTPPQEERPDISLIQSIGTSHPLASATLSSEEEVRYNSINLLVGHGVMAKDAFLIFINGLSDPSRRVRLEAVRGLGNIGEYVPEAITALIPGLENKTDDEFRRRCVSALGEIGNKAQEALTPLIEILLNDNNPALQAEAAASIGKIGVNNPEVLAALTAGLNSDDTNVRFQSALALGLLRPFAGQAAEALRAALNDPDENVRRAARESLQSVSLEPADKNQQIIKELADQLRSSQYSARNKAESQLIEIGNPAIHFVVENLKAEDTQTYLSAEKVLVGVGTPQVRMVLLEATQSPNIDLKIRALKILAQKFPESEAVISAVVSALNDPNRKVRYAAIYRIPETGPLATAGIRPLINLLSDSDASQIAYRAAYRLGQMGPAAKEALPYLRLAKNSPSLNLSSEAIRAIGKVGADDPGVIPFLSNILKNDPEPFHRASAAEGLGWFEKEGDTVLALLINALKNPVDRVRNASIRSMGKMPGQAKTIVPVLKKLLISESGSVLSNVIDTLGNMGAEAQSVLPQLKAIDEERDPTPWRTKAAITKIEKALQSKTQTPAVEQISPSASDKEKVEALLGISIGQNSEQAQEAQEALIAMGETAAPHLIQSILDKQSPDWAARRYSAVRVLTRMGDDVMPLVLQALRKNRRMDISPLIEVTGKTGNNAAVETLIEIYNIPAMDSFKKTAIIEALGTIADDRALPIVVEASKDPDDIVRQAAVENLENFVSSPDTVVAAIMEALKDPLRWVRRSAAESLGNIGDKKAGPALHLAFKAEADALTRSSIAVALKKLGYSFEGKNNVLLLIENGEWEELVRMGTQVVPTLEKFIQQELTTEDYWIVIQKKSGAAKVLAQVQKQKATPLLTSQLKTTTSAELTVALIEALTITEDRRAIPLVQEFTLDVNNQIRRAAQTALRQLGANDPLPVSRTTREQINAAIELSARQNAAEREQAISQLTSIGQPATPELLKILENGSENQQISAVQVLGRIKDRRALRPLRSALWGHIEGLDATPAVRKAIFQALEAFGDLEFTLPVFIRIGLNDKDESVRQLVREIILAIGEPSLPLLQAETERMVRKQDFTGRYRPVHPKSSSEARQLIQKIQEEKFSESFEKSTPVKLTEERVNEIKALILELNKGRQGSANYLGIRTTTYQAIGKLVMVGEDVLPYLLEALAGNLDTQIKINVIKVLNRLEVFNAQIQQALTEAMKEENPEIKLEAAKLLVQSGVKTPEVGQSLLEVAQENQQIISGEAVRLLRDTGPISPEIQPALFELLKQTANESLKGDLIYTLTSKDFSSPQVTAYLIQMVDQSRSYHLRFNITIALGQNTNDSDAKVNKLLALTGDAHHFVRIGAVMGLREVAQRQRKYQNRIVQALMKLLADDQGMVRVNAVMALGVIGLAARPAIPTLVSAYHDDNFMTGEIEPSKETKMYVREVIQMAFRQIHGLTFDQEMTPDQYTEQDRKRLDDLTDELQSDNRQTRLDAVDFLINRWRKVSLPYMYMVEYMHPDMSDLRKARANQMRAQSMLGVSGERTVLAARVLADEILANPAKNFRLRAIEKLGQLGLLAYETIPWLDELSLNPDQDIANAALQALKQITGEELINLPLQQRRSLLEKYFTHDLPMNYAQFAQSQREQESAYYREKYNEVVRILRLLEDEGLDSNRARSLDSALFMLAFENRELFKQNRQYEDDIAQYMEQGHAWPVRKAAQKFLSTLLWKPRTESQTINFYLMHDMETLRFAHLKKIGRPVVEVIAKDLKNSKIDYSDRKRILEVLGEIEDPKAISILIEYLERDYTHLSNDEWHLKNAAIHALSKYGPAARAALPKLLEIYNENKGKATSWAAKTLRAIGLIGDESHIPLILAGFKNEYKDFRNYVLEGLAPWITKNPNAYNAVYEAAQREKYYDARLAVEILVKAEEISLKSHDVILNFLARTDYQYYESVYFDIVVELTRKEVKTAEFIKFFSRQIRSDKENIQLASAIALARMRANLDQALPILIKTIEASYHDFDDTMPVIETLGSIGKDALEALPGLRQLTKKEGEDSLLRQAAQEAVEKIEAASGQQSQSPDRSPGILGHFACGSVANADFQQQRTKLEQTVQELNTSLLHAYAYRGALLGIPQGPLPFLSIIKGG